MKVIIDWMVEEILDDIHHLSDGYQRFAAFFIFMLTSVGAVLAGTKMVFVKMAEIGCAAAIPTLSLMGAGFAGIALFIGAIIGIFILTYVGFAHIPEWFLKQKEEWKYRRENPLPKIPLSKKINSMGNWFKEHWVGLVVILGVGLAIAVASWLFGYIAWLIAC